MRPTESWAMPRQNQSAGHPRQVQKHNLQYQQRSFSASDQGRCVVLHQASFSSAPAPAYLSCSNLTAGLGWLLKYVLCGQLSRVQGGTHLPHFSASAFRAQLPQKRGLQGMKTKLIICLVRKMTLSAKKEGDLLPLPEKIFCPSLSHL